MGLFVLLCTGLLALSPAARAEKLPTSIIEDTTLTKVGSPYTGSSTVASGVTLTVSPGVELSSGTLTVKGTLKATGTAEDPIVFNGVPIKFEPGSGASVLSHVEVKLVKKNETAAVETNASSPTIEHSVFSNNQASAIQVTHGGSPEIAFSTFKGNGHYFLGRTTIAYSAAAAEPGTVNIHDNVIEDGGYTGISATSNTNPPVAGATLGDNTLIGNEGPGITYSGTSIPANITSNLLEGNEEDEIQVSGTVAYSSTWEAGSPVRFGTVTLASGITLNINQGVTINSSSIPGFTVKGTLKATGTAEDPIVFNGVPIKFEPGSGASVLSHVEVKLVKKSETPAVETNASSPTIEHSIFSNNQASAIQVTHGGSPEIAFSTFKGNGHYYLGRTTISYSAGAAEPGVVNIHDNVIKDGGYTGISATSNTNPPVAGATLGDNTLIGNEGPGINYSGTAIPGNITSNLLEGNETDEVLVSGTVAYSSTWEAGSPVRFGGSGVVIAGGVTLNLGPAVYLRNPKLTVYGTLLVEGTASKPVALTGSDAEVAGEWGTINFEAGSGGSRLEYVEIAFGGAGGPMVNIKGVSPTITHSTFRRSGGDAVRVQQSGQPSIIGNRFRGNQFGLRYEGTGTLNATGNDWGCANGPKPTGCGDSVTSNVVWRPVVVLQELPRLCPGTIMLASSPPCLLKKYQPELRYDSQESYFADAADGIVENWGDAESGLWGENKTADPYSNSLFDGDAEHESPNFGLLAQSQPGVPWLPYQLTLSALGQKYPNGQLADSNDWLDEEEDYLKDSQELEEEGYMHAAYGRVITDGAGKKWLEYWYWYYYNPKSVAGFGVHEGDWESILVGLDSNNKPEQVVLSQHSGGAACYPDDLEQTDDGGPVAYVAADSHATYPLAGSYATEVDSDHADGAGVSVQPALVVIGSTPPSWVLWPGHWGNSRASISPIESNSPQGPAFHEAWESPDTYAAGARECFENFETNERAIARAGSETAPSLEGVDLVGGVPLVSYDVPGAAGRGFWPRLRVSINALDDGGLPPVSRTISPKREKGQIAIPPVGLSAGDKVEVIGSVFYKNGRRVHLAPETARLR